jgi:hypothetical protein
MSENDKDKYSQHLEAELDNLKSGGTPVARPRTSEEQGNALTFAWLAGILLTVVLAGGAWWTNGISMKVDKLGETQSLIQTDLAVVKNQVGTILKESK